MNPQRLIIIAVALLCFVVGAIFATRLGGGGSSDPSFSTRVEHPAYTRQHPRVLFDEAHHNIYTTKNGFKPLAELFRHDGYRVEALEEAITQEALAGVTVLVIAGAQGANETNDAPAFTDAEMTAIAEWVLRGGSLLLVTDHWPLGTAVAPLGDRFGIDMSKGLTSDPAHGEPTLGESHIVYSRENGLLRDHPITRGRNESERVSRVLTFTGQSLRAPLDATSFLTLSTTAQDAPPTPPKVTRANGNVRVDMTYGAPVSAAGRSQGLTMTFGRGRIVVLGEMGMLRAQTEGSTRIGMNFPGYDNRQLALNIMHWLSHLI